MTRKILASLYFLVLFNQRVAQKDWQFVRTPDSQFDNLKDYDFTPNYEMVDGLRMHYVDEGPKDGRVIVLLHSEPSWSYLYREMIPPLANLGKYILC